MHGILTHGVLIDRQEDRWTDTDIHNKIKINLKEISRSYDASLYPINEKVRGFVVRLSVKGERKQRGDKEGRNKGKKGRKCTIYLYCLVHDILLSF